MSDTVTPIVAGTFKRIVPTLFDRPPEVHRVRALFKALPKDGITVVVEGPVEEGRETKGEDRIELTLVYKARLMELYEEFGVPQRIPKTWAEHCALMRFCLKMMATIDYWSSGCPEDDRIWHESQDEVRAEYYPELCEPAKAYRNGDRETLKAFGERYLNPENLAWHYDPVWGGWAGSPLLLKKGVPRPTPRPAEATPAQPASPHLRRVK